MLRKSAFLMFLVLSLGLSSVSAQTETPAKPVSVGVVNGKAVSLPKPAYPSAAMAVRAEGAVNVQVLIDEEGNVVSAKAVSGHPLLRAASEQAARGAKFSPTLLSGQAVKVNGVIVYNFVGPVSSWSSIGSSIGISETKGIRRIDLPEGFSDEEMQFEMLGKLSPQEQPAQIANTISLIKSKLNPADLWHFEFGLAKGRILSNAENDNSIFTNLAKFKELANSNPEGVQAFELNRAVELAKFADKANLTREDKEAIFSYLR